MIAMRKALLALLVTAVAVVLLARYETHPPRTYNPNSALRPRGDAGGAGPRAPAAAAACGPGEKAANGPALVTPFSVIQVRATVMNGRAHGRGDRRAGRGRAVHERAERARGAASCAWRC